MKTSIEIVANVESEETANAVIENIVADAATRASAGVYAIGAGFTDAKGNYFANDLQGFPIDAETRKEVYALRQFTADEIRDSLGRCLQQNMSEAAERGIAVKTISASLMLAYTDDEKINPSK